MKINQQQVLATIPQHVVRRHAALHNLSAEEAIRRSEELAKFLSVHTSSDEVLVPSPVVDDIWHDFILDTIEYQRYCANSLGHFVHHKPQEELSEALKEDYEATLTVMVRHFGPLDRRYWPDLGAICDSPPYDVQPALQAAG